MDNLSAKILEFFNGVYIIPGNTNCGVITTINSENPKITDVYLVDSGATEIDGEYVYDILEAFFSEQKKQYSLKAIISTHCHPDHVGGHNFIKSKTNCEIWAAQTEKGTMETPITQSSLLWGGYPPHELRTVFFKPEQTFVDRIISESDFIALSDNRKVSFIELHGHSQTTIGVLISNKDDKKMLFAGDNIFPRGEIMKFWIPLLINPDFFMESLDKICSIKDLQWCIPSHGDFIKSNISETAELNKIAILSTKACILDALEKNGKMTSEELVKYVADKNELEMNFGQYTLINTTVRSYIAVMHDSREIRFLVEDNKLYFTKH